MKIPIETIRHHFHAAGLDHGRHFGSKGQYRTMHPECWYIPNACIFILGQGKIWGGDLDLATKDKSALQWLSRRLRRKLFVLREQIHPEKLTDHQINKYAEITFWRGRTENISPDKAKAIQW